jgi:type I restriction enzyme S subunit
VQEIGYQGVRRGELVIHSMDGFAGAMGVSDSDGKMSPVVHIYDAPADNPYYLAHVLRVAANAGYIQALAKGIRERSTSFDRATFKDMLLPSPERREQDAIVDYISREAAKIDALVAEQEGLVSVLRERRIAVVRHAIPDPSDKPESADRLSRFARIGNGSTPRRENVDYWQGGTFPWLNSAVVNLGRVTGSDQFVTDLALAECHLPVVPAGSILVGLTGQGRTRGMATVLDIEATISQHVAYVTPDPRQWNTDYLRWALSASYGDLRALSDENGSTKGGLTCEDLKRFRLVRPAIRGQGLIADYLDGETEKIDALIAEAEGIVGVAKERRSALITAVVTGQIDVRGEVA